MSSPHAGQCNLLQSHCLSISAHNQTGITIVQASCISHFLPCHPTMAKLFVSLFSFNALTITFAAYSSLRTGQLPKLAATVENFWYFTGLCFATGLFCWAVLFKAFGGDNETVVEAADFLCSKAQDLRPKHESEDISDCDQLGFCSNLCKNQYLLEISVLLCISKIFDDLTKFQRAQNIDFSFIIVLIHSKASMAELVPQSFFLYLLLSSNLLTLFISTIFYSSCSFNPTTTSTKTGATIITTTATAITDFAPKNDVVEQPEESQTTSDFPPKFLAFTSPQTLPFGFNTNFDSERILPPAGGPCTLFHEELWRYMSYKINGSCPDDEIRAQKLLLKGCEPLPRRCHHPAAAPREYVEPHSLPVSYWSTPSDSSVAWTAYTCKNYFCLINRKRNQKGFDDFKDCFDFQGPEKIHWTSDVGRDLDFSIDEVLAVKKPGAICIGLDIGGGVATFAVRMMEGTKPLLQLP